MNIIYSDSDIVVCEKPVGFSSELSSGDNMVEALRKIEGTEIFTIHRLDKAVGGLMVYAKTKFAASELSKQMQDGTFVKFYYAVLCGKPEEKTAVLEDLLFKDSTKNKSYVVKRERKGVKKAKLEYEVVEELKDYTVVKVRLYTGRTHQIRVQFASRGMPLSGDKKYGATDNRENIGLFSCRLEFNHPANGERMKFELIPDTYFV